MLKKWNQSKIASWMVITLGCLSFWGYLVWAFQQNMSHLS